MREKRERGQKCHTHKVPRLLLSHIVVVIIIMMMLMMGLESE